MLDQLNDFLMLAVVSPWVYPLVFLVVFVDGFFPPVPGESVVVAAAALGVSAGHPSLIVVGLLAALGAIAGDATAYLIGRRIGTTRFAWMRRPMIARVFQRAQSGLDRKGTMLILIGRYIPVGRVAVNMTAGATGFAPRRFFPLAALAAVSWATYSIALGLVAGQWAKDNPVVAVAAAVVIAMLIGFLIEWLTRRFRARAGRGQAAVVPERDRVAVDR